MRALCAVASVVLATGPLFAQPRPVDPTNTYVRVLCIVPIVGSGTPSDPKRPLYTPLHTAGAQPGDDEILAFVSYPSDDGQFALVEFVARARAAFEQVFEEKRPDVKCFVRGNVRKDEIEREFRKHARKFDLEKFAVALP